MIEIRERDEGSKILNWGVDYEYLTEEHLKALQEGKKIEINDGEYSTMIVLEKFKQEKEKY